jgi:hypothetical protein
MRRAAPFLLLIACSSSTSEAVGTPDAAAGHPADGGGTVVTLPDGGTTTVPPSDAGTCASDPLHTGLVAQQTGVSVDSFDCAILTATAKYAEPDAMIFKAIIYVESRFDRTSVACPNKPCGTPTGWTDNETGCYGLMQIVPACSSIPKEVLLSNGHPDLVLDPSAAGYSGSVFNPDINIDVGVSGIANNRGQVVKQFPGCTADQYTMMAIGNYNSYGSTKSCTQYNTDYTKIVLDAYKQYATAAGYTAHAY